MLYILISYTIYSILYTVYTYHILCFYVSHFIFYVKYTRWLCVIRYSLYIIYSWFCILYSRLHVYMIYIYRYNLLKPFFKGTVFLGGSDEPGWDRLAGFSCGKNPWKTVCQSWIPPSFSSSTFCWMPNFGDPTFWEKYPTIWDIFCWQGDAETTWKTFGPSNGSEVGKASPMHVAVVSWRIVKGEPHKKHWLI